MEQGKRPSEVQGCVVFFLCHAELKLYLLLFNLRLEFAEEYRQDEHFKHILKFC